jgi:uncharacterized cysteine cluster protein YcgN (CxxCxxCC family)
MKEPFWKAKSFSEMNEQEWESLCDGCAKCCLVKLEDEETNELHYTNVVCDLLDLESCSCTKYMERTRLVPECLKLTPQHLGKLAWMPETCAYRLLSEGKELSSWHPLVSGNSDSVHNAGVSVRAYAMHESDVEDLEDHIIDLK